MKIPETTANVGAYYGNEENGQWQANGVILDSGVGGGVVGSGDAGFVHHAPVYQVPRHLASPGYVMAGAYYEAGAAPYVPPPRDDFADYMWMENEEEFDKQVMQQLEEEALMEQCIEAMLEDEQRELRHRPVNGHRPTTSNGGGASLAETISRSTLNPLAAEFVPTRPLPAPAPAPAVAAAVECSHAAPATAETEKPVEVSAAQEVAVATAGAVAETDAAADSANEESPSPPSCAEVPACAQPVADSTERRAHTPAKRDGKRTTHGHKPGVGPHPANSETKVPVKREVQKDVKTAKSEAKLEESLLDGPPLPEPAKTLAAPTTPVEEITTSLSTTTTTATPAGPKPINYAAAAKANKPKKASTPPATEKPAPPPAKTVADRSERTDRTDRLPSRDKLKADKASKPADRPRKTSAK